MQIIPVENGDDQFYAMTKKLMKSSNMTATNEKEQLKARKDFYKDAKVNEGYLKTCDFLGMHLTF